MASRRETLNGKPLRYRWNGGTIPSILLYADESKASRDMVTLFQEWGIPHEVIPTRSDTISFRALPAVYVPTEDRSFDGEQIISTYFLSRFER